MELHHSTLPKLPPLPRDPDLFFSLEFSFGRSSADTHMQIHSGRPEASLDLVRFWLPFREEGAAWLNWHPAYFKIAVPPPGQEKMNVQLHVAVPFVHLDDIDTDEGLVHRQDFDRLMDLVKQALGEMVRTGLLRPGKTAVDIIAEPLTPGGALKHELIAETGFVIGASWLDYDGRQIFRDYRCWNPEKGAWEAVPA
jgi:hypothetical protein